MLQKATLQTELLPSWVNAKVPLSIRVKLTWLQSSGPAELHHDASANLIWVFEYCSCWPTAEKYCLLPFPLPLLVFSHCEEKSQTQSLCVFGEEGKVVALSVIIWQFYIKAQAWQEVPLRGVFNSDLVYSLFCLNKSQYFYDIVRVIYEFSWNGSVVLHFQI